MKKIMIFIISVMLPVCGVNAAQMCAENTTTTIVLDPSIGGIGYTYDLPTWTWETRFPYGSINGIAACVNTGEGKTRGDTVAGLTEGGNPVVGGEGVGKYCWCKMTHPAVSLWAFDYTSGSASECASNCTYYCGYYVRYDSSLRAGLFGSVAR